MHSNTAEQLTQHFTYRDYCQWPDDERWELIDGVAYAMTAPTRLHQKIVGELGRQMGNYLQYKRCEGYVAPFDVRFADTDDCDDDVADVVQPDIAVICDLNKLDDKGCCGAPDWIIEVLSPSAARKDMHTKRELYQQHGVREYWLIHPTEQWLMIYRLNDKGCYDLPVTLNCDEATPVGIFEELQISWDFLEKPVSR